MELPDTSSARIAIVKQEQRGVIPATPAWLTLPITQATITDQLDSEDSNVLRPDRQYSNARILTGSSGGDAELESFYGPAMDMLLMGLLQSNASAWASEASKFNASVKHYFSIEKSHLDAKEAMVYKWFKDAQVNSMNFSIDANSFSGVTVNFMSVETEAGTDPVVGSSYTSVDMSDQFDTNSVTIKIKDDQGQEIEDVEVESGSVEVGNDLRKRSAVGKFYGAGNASSRFSCMYNFSMYFSDLKFYDAFKANKSFEIEIEFRTPKGNIYKLVSKNCKVTTYDDPIGGIDSDLMVDISFRANADDQSPSRTLEITKVDAA